MRRITFSVMVALSVGACAEQEPAEDAGPAQEIPESATTAETPMGGASLQPFAGTWDAVSYMESGDTVNYTLTATADTTGWMIELPDRDAMPMRVVAVAGDSVVTEVGPYESILREGVMVTVRTTSRMQGDRMVGTMEARYSGTDSAPVVRGRTEAERAGGM